MDRNGGLLELLARYEEQRRRFNADRLGVSEILQRMEVDNTSESIAR